MIIERCDRASCKAEFPILSGKKNLSLMSGSSPDDGYSVAKNICNKCWDELYLWLTNVPAIRTR